MQKQKSGGSEFWIDLFNGEKALIVSENPAADSAYLKLNGKETVLDGAKVKICPLVNENAVIIRGLFPYTAPVSHKDRSITIGLGDRLGLASAGHIDLLRNYDVFPVLAQQSIRELNLTNRTYNDVLDSATWAVFEENYTSGFGADGDHLKTKEEVQMALDIGYTMITLDCSEHIRNDVSPDDPKRDELIYGGAVDHAERIYRECITTCGRDIDFELSIDETPSATLPESHQYVANELYKRGVVLTSLAPRFTGEFQKGIDYKGDVNAFEQDFIAHACIARQFGYKLSVHSGSDKFTVFPLIGKHANGKFHLKTAGTNWLEGVRVIAAKDAPLFRQMLKFSLENLHEAKKYYVTTENTANIPALENLADETLPDLLNQPDARQVLHICYGLILLNDADSGNGATFKERIYKCLNENAGEYKEALRKHIGLHLSTLGIKPV